MTNYWIGEMLKVVALSGSAWVLGRLVLTRGWRVNYTRKIMHFLLFFLAIGMGPYLPYESTALTTLISGALFLSALLLMAPPLRNRFEIPRTAFAAFDRPEDRPYTMLWLWTQIVATYAVLFPILYWLDTYDAAPLIYIAAIISGIGDGLAEPVGVRFGRHRYTTRAIFSDRRYTRSLEGSACVFGAGILALVLMSGELTPAQFWIGLAIIPLATTLAEAFSPHTWDSPFIYGIGGLSIIATLELAALAA